MAHNPTATTITIQQTLELLDGQFHSVALGVAEDRYAFWLGSGISFGCVDGLRQIVPRVLEFLRVQITSGDDTCRFRAALTEALSLASLSGEEWGRVDFDRPFADWADSEAITARLINNYARLLDVPVNGEPSDYLLWSGVDVASTFADPLIGPDVEHLCMAILMLEGVASDVASANWDGLIESAANGLAAGQLPVTVYVRPENLRELMQRSRLYKFHGCAVRAVDDEANYRPFLIARQSQINGWATKPEHLAIVNQLVNIIVSKPTIMMGLSAQDANIQALFARAANTMEWPWPGDRPSFVFSEDRVGPDQKGMLQNVYREAYDPATRAQIEAGAHIRAYAKPLLVALSLHVLCSKLRHLVMLAPGALSPADRVDLQTGIVTLRNKIANSGNGDRLVFIQTLIDYGSRIISLFRDGQSGALPRCYNPITTSPIQRIAIEPGLHASGLCEAAIAIGILGVGIRDGLWDLSCVDTADPVSGAINVTSVASSAKIIFVANSHSALRLHQNGHIDSGEDTVIVYSSEIAPTFTRSPRSAPGRTGKLGTREVSISTLLGEATSAKELLHNFRVRVSL